MIAALAFAAAPVAPAAAFDEFHSESAVVAFTGTQSGSSSFTAGSNGTITCSSGMFRGMIISTSSLALATSDEPASAPGIEYSGCKFLGIPGVIVEPHSCQYTFHGAAVNTKNGTVDIGPATGTCATAGITFSAGLCTITIKPQTGINGIEYRDNHTGEVSKRDITIIPSATNIHYTAGSGCLSPGAYTDGTYTNVDGTTVTAATATPITEKSTMVGFWVE
jgi:hypothetical protein